MKIIDNMTKRLFVLLQEKMPCTLCPERVIKKSIAYSTSIKPADSLQQIYQDEESELKPATVFLTVHRVIYSSLIKAKALT